MSTNPTLTDLRHVVLADRLGQLRAEAHRLAAEAKEIEAQLKEEGVTEINGQNFRVVITYDISTNRTDWKAIAAKLNPSRQLITAHSKHVSSDRVTVKALIKEA